MLSADGVRPGEQKIIAVQQFPQPQNKHEVKRFLGLCGFFRRYNPSLCRIALPVSELLKEQTPYVWTQVQKDAFQRLKNMLSDKPVLQLFSADAYTELHCDASSMGLSGMLLQKGEDKLLHLIHAMSKKTTPTEKNYHSSKQELMAVVWSMTKLRPYFVGIKFLVVTDFQAIVHLNTQKTVQPQIARWATLLSEYDFEIQHRAGIKMSHVDALRRTPTDEPGDTEAEVLDGHLEVLITLSEEEQVIAMQHTDVKLRSIMKVLCSNETFCSKVDSDLVKDIGTQLHYTKLT